jgi:hypothetical protein
LGAAGESKVLVSKDENDLFRTIYILIFGNSFQGAPHELASFEGVQREHIL